MIDTAFIRSIREGLKQSRKPKEEGTDELSKEYKDVIRLKFSFGSLCVSKLIILKLFIPTKFVTRKFSSKFSLL